MKSIVLSSFAGVLTLVLMGSFPLGPWDDPEQVKEAWETGNDINDDMPEATAEDGYFIENRGQWDDEILFIGETPFGRIGIMRGSIVFDIVRSADTAGARATAPVFGGWSPENIENVRVQGNVIRYDFIDGNDVVPKGEEKLLSYSNYFIGNDPSGWVSRAGHYRTVTYEDLWDDIDLRYMFDGEAPKYELVVHPGADIEDIALRVEGMEGLCVRDDGIEIVMEGGASMRDGGLEAFYNDDRTERIGAGFRSASGDVFGFRLDDWDGKRTAVIDPWLVSTYFGGTSYDWSYDVNFDVNGNIIVFGYTYSTDLPTVAGSYDTTHNGGSYDFFVTKFDQTGSNLLFSTYIGGSSYESSFYGYPNVLVTDEGILIMGTTYSSNYPTTSGCYDSSLGGYQDIVFSRLSLDGATLLVSSYFGGSNYEYSYGALTSMSGGFYILGSTYGADLPFTSGAYQRTLKGYLDDFIVRFASDDKTIEACTLIGGSGYYDSAYGIIEDENGDFYVAGMTTSTDWPMISGCYDITLNGNGEGFVTKMKGDMTAVLASTFLGGVNNDGVNSIGFDLDGNIVVAGYTLSPTFPVTGGAYQSSLSGGMDAFVTKFNPGLTSIIASTLFGGAKEDNLRRIIVDDGGSAILSGSTYSTNLPMTTDAEDNTFGGGSDIYISMLSNDLSTLEYSTFYGGSKGEQGGAIGLDPVGKLVVIGNTTSTDLPTLIDAYQTTLRGSTDVFVFGLEHAIISEPIDVEHIKVYSDQDYLMESRYFDIGSRVFVELKGTDSNATRRDGAKVNITYNSGLHPVKALMLLETGKNTGLYRNSFSVPLDAVYLDWIDIVSWKDPARSAKVVIDYPFRPSFVSSVTIHPDPISEEIIDKVDFGHYAFVRALGFDTNPSTLDKAFVNLTSDKNSTMKDLFVLTETGQSTGVYIGGYLVAPPLRYHENITVSSVESPAKTTVFMIHTPLKIRTGSDIENATEDIPYLAEFWNFGYSAETWTVSMSAQWLIWDGTSHVLSGTPTNREVGLWEVYLNISDDKGNLDLLEFQIKVTNAPPNILTSDLLTAVEDQMYLVDYDSDDDLSGVVKWNLLTNASFLGMDEDTGELKGTPLDDDVGIYYVIVQAKDGSDGTGMHSFNLTVDNTNDRPIISTFDVKEVDQGDLYRRMYQAEDPDVGDEHSWFLVTDADWLAMDIFSGELSGTPDAYDVGAWTVNITVMDLAGAKDFHEFQLEVMDIKDKPVFIDVPRSVELRHGTTYHFDVNATDPDDGDVIEYSVRTLPETDMEIGPVTGDLEWTASIIGLLPPDHELEVTIKASDGELYSSYTFKLTVVPTEPPVSTLVSPLDGMKSGSKYSLLEWTASDPDGEALTYDVYLHVSESYVLGKREEALLVRDNPVGWYNVTGLERGMTYFWMVYPFDTCSIGTCTNGPFSLRVNSPPVLKAVEDQKATVGSGFKVKVTGTDPDTEDTLTFSLVEAPKGMEIKASTGIITWEPREGQEGGHLVRVRVNDGLESTETVFEMEVSVPEGFDPIILMIGSIAAFELFVIVVLVVLLLRKSKGTPAEAPKESESEKIMREIEELDKERQWEKEHATGPEPGKTIVSVPQEQAPPAPAVPTSPMEAHEHDKEQKKYTYEDLYGLKMPERTESELEKEIQGSSVVEEEPVKQEKEESWDD